MQIRFMGTGAVDFLPLLETEYKYKLDQNARRSSSILINETYLVDCGPHVAESFQIQQIDAAKVTDLLGTHFHSDHYNRDSIAWIAAQKEVPLKIWHHAEAQHEPIENCEFCPMEIAQDGKLVLSHLARTLHKPHEETVEMLKPDGYIVAYDGMELEV